MKQVWKNNKWIRTTALVLAMLILAFLYAHVGKNHYYYDRSADTGSFVMMPPAASGESVEETFVSAENAIDGINIKCSQIGDVSAVTLHVRILASDGRTVLSEAEVPVADFKNNRFNKIKLDKVKDVRDKSLILSLSQTGAGEGNGLAFYRLADPEKGALIFRTITNRFDLETFLVTCFILAYIILFFRVIGKLFR